MAEYAFTGAKWGSSILGTGGGQVTWSFAGLQGSFYSFDASINQVTYQNLIKEAFQVWESVANIDFVEVVDSNASNVRLGWDWIDGRFGTVGEAKYSSWSGNDFRQLARAEIRFDTAEAWSTAKHYVSGPTNFFAVAVHEIGHALGLAHTDEKGTIMFPSIGTQVALSSGDIAGAKALYGSNVDVSANTGTNASETIYGNANNDRLSGGGGNDYIDGGAGIDTAMFGGRMNEFSLSQLSANGIAVVDLRVESPEGTDTLTSIERLSFTDGTLAFDFSGTAGQAYRIYQAAFARTPDNDGLEFWIDQMDGGMNLQEVSRRFVDSAEFKAIYDGDSIQAYVDGLYRNVLGRSGEDAGVSFWVDEISSGHRDSAKALADFSESSENVMGVAPAISDGIWYS